MDSDNDGIIEAALGGSLGGAGAPPVKPAWAIENNSAADRSYTLTIMDTAHECVYDDAADLDCNSCGAERDVEQGCQHVYDHDFDTNCNTCMEQRKVELPLSVLGTSISEDVNGLAWLIEAKVDGMEVDGITAIYDNATVNGYKLITMGAVVSNNYHELNRVPNLDDVDAYPDRVHNVPAERLYSIDEDGTVTFADEYKDREIDILTYIIFEDATGVQHTLYCNSAYASYDWVLNS